MTQCANCLGDGIVGSGPEPWLKVGAKVTCPKCGGTGQISDGEGSATVETPPAPTVPADSNTAPVDNSDEPKGIVERVADAILG